MGWFFAKSLRTEPTSKSSITRIDDKNWIVNNEIETYLILCQMDAGEITLKEAHELILRLFGVMESDCDHEWLNHSFDHFGLLKEQICDKCGAKQSVP